MVAWYMSQSFPMKIIVSIEKYLDLIALLDFKLFHFAFARTLPEIMTGIYYVFNFVDKIDNCDEKLKKL